MAPAGGNGTIILAVGNDTDRAKAVLGYVNGDTAYNPEGWKLGDTFHSNPITVGSPSMYFVDFLSPDAFSAFREIRKNRERLVFLGSNDGQFHAFDATTGDEKWSFIPPNLLPKLQYLAHSSHNGDLPKHVYFNDGPVSAADIWLGSGDGTGKRSSDWKTLLVFSEGRGVRDSANSTSRYLWSSSSYCDQDFNGTYTGTTGNTYPYYCGYWALDVTETSLTSPQIKWRLNPTSQHAPYLGEPWSKMSIGRVRISGSEKWAGFIGGGYDKDGNPNRGRGFFVVDLSNGNILWSFTKENDAAMTHTLPGSAAVVDTDNDGFIDTAYMGDLGGNVWRFRFCTKAEGSSCNITNWGGGKFFQSSAATPIYSTPSATRDSNYIWVFWGTGDKENPNIQGTQDLFFAVKDTDRSATYTINQLESISGSVFSNTTPGWYVEMGRGEKVLVDSDSFGGMITWTTFTPGGDACSQGASKLYALAMMPITIAGVVYQPGAGLFANTSGNVTGTRFTALGAGIPHVPIYSQKPGRGDATDAYIPTSGALDTGLSIQSSTSMGNSPFKQRLQMTSPAPRLLHWLDRRMR